MANLSLSAIFQALFNDLKELSAVTIESGYTGSNRKTWTSASTDRTLRTERPVLGKEQHDSENR